MRQSIKNLNGLQIIKPQDLQLEFKHLLDRPFAQFSHVLNRLNVSSNLRVTNDEKQILVKADVPGFETKDVHVKVERGFLLIYGKKGYQHKSQHNDFYSYESTSREFSHCLPLPKSADTKKITSAVKNGILEITILKKL